MNDQAQDALSQRFIPGARVRLAHGHVRVCPPGQEREPEPQIILIRDGEAVTAIEVICTCGQRIRLKCEF